MLAFRSHLRAVPDGDERVFLLGDDERVLLVGRAHARVAALIDGRRSVARVLAELAGELHPAVAHDAIVALEARGYLIRVEPHAPARVAVRALADGDGAEVLRDALGASGVALDDGASVQIVVVDDYLAPALEAVGREALAAGVVWWLVKLAGTRPWIGPAFRPGGPCWACLAHRLRDNRPVERYLERRGRRIEPPHGPHAGDPAVRRAAASWAALAIRGSMLLEGAPPDHLAVFDPHGPRVVEHRVARRPQCPACGDPALFSRRAASPIVLVDRPIDHGARTRSAAETFEHCAHLVDPLTGAISSLGPVAGTDGLVWAASLFTHPASDPSSSATASFDDFHATSMGKGETSEQARTAALGEAIERLSAVYQGDEPVRIASLRELEAGSDRAIHPDALQLFSFAQLAGRDAWNRAHDDVRRHVPLPFDSNAPVAWTPAWSLTPRSHGQQYWIPAAYCYLAVPAAHDPGFFQPSSNGHGVGNCLEEAILQGLLELVERDAVAIWWYGRVRRPGVELAERFVGQLAARGWTAWALDLTHDLGIAVRAALARDARGRWCVGFGAHLDPAVALARATGELRQLLVLGDERCVWDAGALPDHAFLYPDATAEPVPAAAIGAVATSGAGATSCAPIRDLRAAVEHVVARVARAGLDTLVVDQTRPDLGLCAVKVVVPNLRHFWPRFAPGRLYDVPERLGWTHALTEADLNPVPLFL